MAPHLTLDERRILARLLHQKISIAQTAAQLGRHRSTIHREIRRNFWHDPEVPMATGYWHVTAQQLAAARRARQRKLIRHPSLRAAVLDRLKEGWSPEQIAGRLKLASSRPRVCHETIYRYVYSADSSRNWPVIFPRAAVSASRATAASPGASSSPRDAGSGIALLR